MPRFCQFIERTSHVGGKYIECQKPVVEGTHFCQEHQLPTPIAVKMLGIASENFWVYREWVMTGRIPDVPLKPPRKKAARQHR